MRCPVRAVSGGCRFLCLTLLLLALSGVKTVDAGKPRIRARGANVEINGKPAAPRFKFGGLYLFSPAEPKEAEEELEPPLPPSQFNPDPGVIQEDGVVAPPDLFPPVLPELLEYGEEMVPRSLGLPRKGVREVRPYRKKLPYPDYEGIEADAGMPQGAQAVPNRWFVGFGRWQRYADPSAETPYQAGDIKIWHPYFQSLLKGDAPILSGGHLPQLDADRLRAIRGAQTASAERRERAAAEQLRVLRARRPGFLLERFPVRDRHLQR